jgi:hypothetical protein
MEILQLALAATAALVQDPEGIEFFEKKIRPVLAERCHSCHSAKAEKLKGALLLDSREGIEKGGSQGRAVAPGDPEGSLLIRAIRQTDEDLKMPPKGRLTPEEVADFEEWVRRGAPAPAGRPPSIRTDPRAHWAFKPVADPAPPPAKGARTEIDRFVRARLEEKGLAPAPPADRRTLLRRATFDLHGLPPTPEELAAFEADGSFEKVVDRLLASPRYGERWGRHWLDVARYADTKGYAFEERRFAYSWAYRDWVIRAFNEDLPYDRFLVLQIAGERAAEDPRDLAAMGFLTIGRRFLNNVHDIIDDRLDVVFRGTQALSVGCARCHDHKYDPIPTEDYYSLYGVFASSREPDDPPLAGTPPRTAAFLAYEKERSEREAEAKGFLETRGAELLASLKSPGEIAKLLAAAHEMRALHENDVKPEGKRRKLNPAVLARWWWHLREASRKPDPLLSPWHALVAGSELPGIAPAAERTLQEAAALYAEHLAVRVPEAEREELFRRVLFDPAPWLRNLFYPDGGPMEKAPENPVEMLFDESDRKKLGELRKKAKELEFTHAGAPARGMILEDLPEPVTPRVFIRGNKATLGKEAPRRFLAVLSGAERKPFAEGSGRLELARAIACRENPLTARVMANRIWMHHFGQGLVRTPSDFGLRSDPPTHPELLDWLASRFAGSAPSTPPGASWSIKKMHRLIMLSDTYRQSSEGDPAAARVDPENLLLWRANPRRLEFEAMRDSILAVAGRLDGTPGGRGSDIAGSRRRTVYTAINRQTLPGVYRAFDFANPDAHVPQRSVTTIPQQALFLMNAPFAIEQSRALAARSDVARESDPDRRIERIYRLLFGRAPSEGELAAGRAFVAVAAPACDEECDCGARTPLGPWEKYAQVLLQSNEFMYVD